LYRVIGLRFLETGKLGLDTLKLSMQFIDGEQRMFDGDRDVTGDIRKHEVSKAASDCSALPEVRAFLLDLQRDIAKEYNVVMDGRDIGTTVLPGADLKIYLTAAAEARAQRRFDQLKLMGKEVPPIGQILQDINDRDHKDSTREESPLRQAEDAIVLDTTSYTFEQSAERLESMIREKLAHVL
jgi:cytidylate kinase